MTITNECATAANLISNSSFQKILDVKYIAYDPWLSRDCQSISGCQGYSDKEVKSIHG